MIDEIALTANMMPCKKQEADFFLNGKPYKLDKKIPLLSGTVKIYGVDNQTEQKGETPMQSSNNRKDGE